MSDMRKDPIQGILQALADADASREAPAGVEIRLRKAFRVRRRRRTVRQVTVWMSAAAVIVIMFVFINRRPAVAPIVKILPIKTMPANSKPEAVPKPDRAEIVVQMRKSVAPRRAQPEEIVTDFFPLIEPAPPFQRGQILRIEVPASAMQMVGLPIHEEHLRDPVEADVLIGEEGLPRAIRFVKLNRE